MAMAAASMISSHSQRQKQLKAAVQNAKLQRAKLNRARARQAGDFATNAQRAREATQAREIQMEENALKGESSLQEAFAGSGISGTSVSELENELDTQVAKNKVQNKKALDQQLGDMYRQNLQKTEDINAQSTNIGAIPEGDSPLDQITGAIGAYNATEGINSDINKLLGL
jgi:hypothetical protein|tara:strand:- start:18557 stop:19069 length:513 start_codon:yes stop_codon:yes gene_type:complete